MYIRILAEKHTAAHPVLIAMISTRGFFRIFGRSNEAPPVFFPDSFFWPSSRTLLPAKNNRNLFIILAATKWGYCIQTFSFKKMHLKMSSAKLRPFCLGLNVLIEHLKKWRWCLISIIKKKKKMGLLLWNTYLYVISVFNYSTFFLCKYTRIWVQNSPISLLVYMYYQYMISMA